MKAALLRILVPASLLLVVPCLQIGATTVNHNVFTDGEYTCYEYTLTSHEADDYITAFHIYAPVDISLVTGACESPDWTFAKAYDSEISAADLYWYVSNPGVRGLAFGDSLQFAIQTSASLPTIEGYVIPDYLGNWGIETEMWGVYGVFVMLPSVPVPCDVSEPCTVVAVGMGLAGFALRRRPRV